MRQPRVRTRHRREESDAQLVARGRPLVADLEEERREHRERDDQYNSVVERFFADAHRARPVRHAARDFLEISGDGDYSARLLFVLGAAVLHLHQPVNELHDLGGLLLRKAELRFERRAIVRALLHIFAARGPPAAFQQKAQREGQVEGVLGAQRRAVLEELREAVRVFEYLYSVAVYNFD